jgi:excisionase family DNA binding protein
LTNLAEPERTMHMSIEGAPLQRRWYTVAEVAEILGYGQSKVRMLILQGDLKSLKDGGSRRVLPEWVEEFVQLRAQQTEDFV